MKTTLMFLLSSGIGFVYKAVYTEDIDTLKKFIIALLLTLMLSLTWMLYVEEEHVKTWAAILVSASIGLLSNNLASIVIKVGNKSEEGLASNISSWIRNQIPGNKTPDKNDAEPN